MAETLTDLTLATGLPLMALAAALLWRLYYKSRTRLALVIALAVTIWTIHSLVYGLIFKNNDTIPPWFDLATTKILTRVIEYGADLVIALAVLGLFLRRKPADR